MRAARLLPLCLLTAASIGCGVFAGPSPTPTPTSTPTVTPTRTSTPTATPSQTPTPVPSVDTPVVEVAQGNVAVLRVSASAVSATAYLRGAALSLLPAPGGFWGVIAAAADEAPGQYPVSIVLSDASGGTIAELAASVIVYDTAFPVEQIVVPPDQSGLLDPALSRQEAATRASVFARFTPERLWSGAFIFPVAGGVISSPFGIGRSYNGGPVASFHHGSDFSVDEGTPVVAAATGRVAFVGALPIRGNSVIIDHGAGVFSGYHHLQRWAVAQGQSMAQGDLVGYVGMSGLSTGPHLHWEVIVRGVEVDPVFWTYEEIGP